MHLPSAMMLMYTSTMEYICGSFQMVPVHGEPEPGLVEGYESNQRMDQMKPVFPTSQEHNY